MTECEPVFSTSCFVPVRRDKRTSMAQQHDPGHDLRALSQASPPRGPKMGPGTQGIDLKSKKEIQKFGPEVSSIFEILIFGFGGVFLWKFDFFNFSLFFTPGGALGPPPGKSRGAEHPGKVKGNSESTEGPWGARTLREGRPPVPIPIPLTCAADRADRTSEADRHTAWAPMKGPRAPKFKNCINTRRGLLRRQNSTAPSPWGPPMGPWRGPQGGREIM